MKNSMDIIGNRTRYLAACSAVPQPTAPPHAPLLDILAAKFYVKLDFVECLRSLNTYSSLCFLQRITSVTNISFILSKGAAGPKRSKKT